MQEPDTYVSRPDHSMHGQPGDPPCAEMEVRVVARIREMFMDWAEVFIILQ